MKRIIFALPLVLTGCITATGGSGVLLTQALEIGISDLCVYGNNQYAKLGNPTTLQQIAKAKLDAVCADPNAASTLIVNTYNQLAVKINAPTATEPK